MKWQKKVFFLVFLPVEEMREETGGGGAKGGGFEGAPEGGHLFGGGRFLERGCLFIAILKCCIPNWVEVRSDKRVAEKLEGVKTWQTMN